MRQEFSVIFASVNLEASLELPYLFQLPSDEGVPGTGGVRSPDAHGAINEERTPATRTGTDDALLVTQLRSESEIPARTALTALFDRYASSLWRFATRQLGSSDAANDAVQEVFIALWERRSTLPQQISINVYLYGAVRRRGLHLLRHERSLQDSARRGGEFLVAWRAAAPEPPDAETMTAELEAAFGATLQTLAETQRSAMALRQAGLSHAEVGEALGISAEAARKQVGRAVEALRKTLDRFA